MISISQLIILIIIAILLFGNTKKIIEQVTELINYIKLQINKGNQSSKNASHKDDSKRSDGTT